MTPAMRIRCRCLLGAHVGASVVAFQETFPVGPRPGSEDRRERRYRFGEFTLDVDAGVLRRGEARIDLRPNAFELLAYLVEHHGRVVRKDELIATVWADVAVTDNSLTQCMAEVRRALADDRREIIHTQARRGYVFAAPVTVPIVEFPREASSHLASLPISVADPRSLTRRRIWGTVALLLALVTAVVLWRQLNPPVAATRTAQMLLRGTSGAAVAPAHSLAVLPFRPLGQSGDEYLGMGMADSLITRLGLLRNLEVRPLASVQLYGDRKKDPQAAGRELQVQSVLDGSLQRDGNRLRVRVRLYRVDDGRLLWADQFDEPYRDIFAVQDSISEKVAAALSLELGMKPQRLVDPRAYESFVRGRYFFEQFTREGNWKAVEYFENAIRIQPDFALAYAGLAINYGPMIERGFISAEEAAQKLRAAAARAIALDDALAEAHLAMATAHMTDLDWSGAERSLKHAIELNPNYLHAHGWYTYLLRILGRHEEALALGRRLIEIDPVSDYGSKDFGVALVWAGRPDEALEQLRKALELRPDFGPTHFGLAHAYREINRLDEAHRHYVDAGDPFGAAYVRALQGNTAPARQLLEESSEEPRGYSSRVGLALLYTALGDKERALRSLEQAAGQRAAGIVFLNVDKRFAPLRNEPRFKNLIARMHLSPVSFTASSSIR